MGSVSVVSIWADSMTSIFMIQGFSENNLTETIIVGCGKVTVWIFVKIRGLLVAPASSSMPTALPRLKLHFAIGESQILCFYGTPHILSLTPHAVNILGFDKGGRGGWFDRESGSVFWGSCIPASRVISALIRRSMWCLGMMRFRTTSYGSSSGSLSGLKVCVDGLAES